MHFTKMHGIGNDYVYVDCTKETVPDPSALSIRVSDRHFGIGSDGLILIMPSETADCEMQIYNADGSRGKMCGNGIRCVGKYVYDHGLTSKKHITVDTLSGIKTLDLMTGEDGKVKSVAVDMGEPVLIPEEIPCTLPGEKLVGIPYQVGGKEYRITCVSMGNPHCVVFMDEDVYGLDLEKIGPAFEHNEIFPEGVNTEFVNVLGKNHIRMRVWERGSGETWACGTGASAAAVASILNSYTWSCVRVSLRGGDLEITWDHADGHVTMTGPAEEVYEGDINV